MRKNAASLSLDLDNLWSYLKVHGDSGWTDYPTYLPRFAPLILDFLRSRNLKITFFIVGQDALQPANRDAIKALADDGHEIGNHSLSHEPWMQNYGEEDVVREIATAEEALAEITGHRTIGFRGPGYATSRTMLRVLHQRGYQYDASLFPTLIGPLARLYYFWGTKVARKAREDRGDLFGHLSDGFAPLRPFLYQTGGDNLLAIPVTTMPVFRIPFHLSYLIWMSRYSKTLAKTYLRCAIRLCKIRRIQPSYLLHPLDFLGCEDVKELRFFPGMDLPRDHKLEIANDFLDTYMKHFAVIPVREHARKLRDAGCKIRPLPAKKPHQHATASKDCGPA